MSRGKRRWREIRVRRCIATGKRRHQDELIRFVVREGNELEMDLDRSSSGRGIWLSCSRCHLQRAVSGNLFIRAARRQLVIPPDLPDRVDRALVGRLQTLLGIFGKPADIPDTAHPEGSLLFLPGGVGAVSPVPPGTAMFSCLAESELQDACGSGSVCGVLVLGGGIASRIRLEAQRLSDFRESVAKYH